MKSLVIIFAVFASTLARAEMSCVEPRDKTINAWTLQINQALRGAIVQKMVAAFQASGIVLSPDAVPVTPLLQILPVPCASVKTCGSPTEVYRVYGQAPDFEIDVPGQVPHIFAVQLQIENGYDALSRDLSHFDRLSTHPVFSPIGDLIGWKCFYQVNAQVSAILTNRQTGAYIGSVPLPLSLFDDVEIDAN